jgi:DNA-binding response OmpR family regulator
VKTAHVKLIESSRANSPSFAPALRNKGYRVSVHYRVNDAIAAARKEAPDLFVLDAASMRTSGARMCRKLAGEFERIPIIHIAPEGADPKAETGANVTLPQPFTPRKLLNRVTRWLPPDEGIMVSKGPIVLNKSQRRVMIEDRDSRLTPKLVDLLEMFLRNPGELLTRKAIMRDVWNTDYTGDTRTLDVHMSWLRQAIEADPARPELLRTVRGQGYRLELPRQTTE